MRNPGSAAFCAVLALSVVTQAVGAQGKLAGSAQSGLGPIFERWQFGGDGIPQPTIDGSASVRVTRLTQWSVPIAVAVPIGDRWTVDLTSAYASSEVDLGSVKNSLGIDPDTDRLTYRELQERRELIRSRFHGKNLS